MEREYKVLSIEAWAGDDPGTWDWNAWYNAGNITLDISDSDDVILNTMQRDGYITKAEGGAIDDDGYNMVIIDKKTREPIFAIEYGSVL